MQLAVYIFIPLDKQSQTDHPSNLLQTLFVSAFCKMITIYLFTKELLNLFVYLKVILNIYKIFEYFLFCHIENSVHVKEVLRLISRR